MKCLSFNCSDRTFTTLVHTFTVTARHDSEEVFWTDSNSTGRQMCRMQVIKVHKSVHASRTNSFQTNAIIGAGVFAAYTVGFDFFQLRGLMAFLLHFGKSGYFYVQCYVWVTEPCLLSACSLTCVHLRETRRCRELHQSMLSRSK